jgi:aryl-alcohol dehydrogenase-like predicted oxidoreductase
MTDIKALLKDSKAEYRQLGKSGLRVSVPILGAMSIGDKRWLPLLKAAYDKGITTWDTGSPPPNPLQ